MLLSKLWVAIYTPLAWLVTLVMVVHDLHRFMIWYQVALMSEFAPWVLWKMRSWAESAMCFGQALHPNGAISAFWMWNPLNTWKISCEQGHLLLFRGGISPITKFYALPMGVSVVGKFWTTWWPHFLIISSSPWERASCGCYTHCYIVSKAN